MSEPSTPPDPYEEETLAAAGAAPAERRMGFLDHLEELRGTLLKCAVVFAIFVTIIAYRLEEAQTLLMMPLDSVKTEFPHLKLEVVTNSPMSVFTVIINICLIGGVVMSLPFWIFFLARFVAPALNDKEMRVVVPTGLSAFALFLAGCGFGYYFLTPSTIRVSLELNEMLGYTVMWTADKYYSMLMWLVLGMGAAFEFPLLVVLAVYLGLVEVATLRKYRRHAIVAIFLIAAIVTPTPDPLNQALFALPLIVLYEASILVAARITERRKRAAAA